MFNGIDAALAALTDSSVEVLAYDTPTENGQAPVVLIFSEQATLRADYWRLIRDGRADVSSFDHGQLYGGSSPMDAVDALREVLDNRTLTGAILDRVTGDLNFSFSEDCVLQVFNVTSYQIWVLRFSSGAVEYSNRIQVADKTRC